MMFGERKDGSPKGRNPSWRGSVHDSRPGGRAQLALQVSQLGGLLMVENYRPYQQPGLWGR